MLSAGKSFGSMGWDSYRTAGNILDLREETVSPPGYRFQKRGLSAESPKASRILLMALFRP